jgi:hypothetical protein
MNYTIDHIKAAFRAAKKGLSEAGFLNYLEFHSLLAEDAPTVKPGRKAHLISTKVKASKVKTGKRAKRGKLGKSITKFLQGKTAGAHVKDIAAAVKTKPANITAWIYTTGKKLTKKVKPATFALK